MTNHSQNKKFKKDIIKTIYVIFASIIASATVGFGFKLWLNESNLLLFSIFIAIIFTLCIAVIPLWILNHVKMIDLKINEGAIIILAILTGTIVAAGLQDWITISFINRDPLLFVITTFIILGIVATPFCIIYIALRIKR